MYYVYIITNTKTGRLYIGYTENLKRRLLEHEQGKTKSTTQNKWILTYYEAYLSKEDATQREWDLKHQGRQRDFIKKKIQVSHNFGPIV
ncbi:MAG: GIY-YIG nuclease family protein [Patescibacteria group bacterium]